MALQDEKYLTFVLGDESYAIPILKIKEIIGIMPITKAPNLPNFIKGVINLRGKIIPLIDLRLKFGLEGREYDDKTSIIVVELKTESGNRTSGIVVDTVNEVLDIVSSMVEPPPQYGTDIDQEFLTGMGKVNDKVIMLLNVNRILSAEETKEIETLGKK